MKKQTKNQLLEQVQESLEMVQKPAFLMSSFTSGVCVFSVIASVVYGLAPSLDVTAITWEFTLWNCLSALANLAILAASLYVGFLVDFRIIRVFGNYSFSELAGMIAKTITLTPARIASTLLIGAVAVGGAVFSFTTSMTGSGMIAQLGTNKVQVDGNLRKEYELAVKDQKAELAAFDRDLEGAKIEAEDKRQKAIEAAKTSTYFARMSESEYFANKYQKLLDAADATYKKEVEAAEKAAAAKKADYQKLSGGLVDSKKQALTLASTAAEGKVAATSRIVTNLGVWPLILGIIIMGISACLEVAERDIKSGNNQSRDNEPRHRRDTELNSPFYSRQSQAGGNV